VNISWIALYPDWYVGERRRLATHYPEFWVDESALSKGKLIYYGELVVRPSDGTHRYPVMMQYPEGTPFEPPIVVPVGSLPERADDGTITRRAWPCRFDHRHQMPDGRLCLFQRETRAVPGGDVVRGTDALHRAAQWFLGLCTGHWPPDSAETELEAHFRYATDVLVGDIFFSSHLSGFGRFFMVRDLRRFIDSEFEGLCPMIVTAMTEEENVVVVHDARHQISDLFPWIRDGMWNPETIADLERAGSDTARMVDKGYWWSLPAEPRPFHDGSGMLRELAAVAAEGDAWGMLSSKLGHELATSSRHFFGLRYPDRHGGVEWLLFLVDRGDRGGAILVKSEDEKRREFEGSPAYGLRVHSARPRDLRLRNTGVVRSIITEKTVALIGLGALGSSVAELLAKAGVGQFRLCDCDRLSTGNVARHVGGLSQFGALKTRVVMSRLLDINPYLSFSQANVISGSAVASLGGLSGLIGSADLAICTTADESVESIVNQVAVVQQKPVVYGRALRRGCLGRVFMVRPGLDACKGCLARYARDGRDGKEVPRDWIDVVESEDDLLLHECGRPVIPASAIDLSFVASLIARVALDILEGNAAETNHWLWSRLPATDVDCRLDREMCTFRGHLDPVPDCPACREPEVRRPVWSQDVRDSIVSMTESSPEAETGGILIGFIDDERRARVLRATGAGPEGEGSRTHFSRDVDYVQAELDRAASELGGLGAYIGEWHSHLEADPEASPTDIDSLVGISEAPHYLTRCPVMVIAGLDPPTGRVRSLKSWAFQIGGRMYPVEAETSELELLGEGHRGPHSETPVVT